MRTNTDPWSSENPWTQQALANDHHLGDREEAQIIAWENDQADPETCGLCGSKAYYRHTVGVVQCPACGALHTYVKAEGRMMWRSLD